MVLKLYGPTHPGGRTGILAMTLLEKDIPFEFVYLDMAAREHKSAEHLARHPFGLVPIIDKDGFVLDIIRRGNRL
ncbi:putative glutathione-s-transferase theta, gst [Mycena vulgaris]|nr:putative glutathione-s-transferase theta, gst [Mycena vulgaris]